MKNSYESAQPFITKDGSLIRELMHPKEHGNEKQSLAEARIAPGGRTFLHSHAASEEIYHVIGGCGLMRLDQDMFPIVPGDTVYIAPGVAHGLINDGDEALVVLCCCVPPYSHDDTKVLEPEKTTAP